VELAEVLVSALDMPFQSAVYFFVAGDLAVQVLTLFKDSAILRGLRAAFLLLGVGE